MHMKETLDIPIVERARRVKIARLLTCQPRMFFERNHGIKSATLKSWEMPIQSRGITAKGAVKLSHALSIEGIHCSVEWLLNGVEPEPRLISTIQKKPEEQTWNEEFNILSEIELFKKNNKNSIVILVSDDSMLPFYNAGDHVGGVFRTGNAINEYINRRCIIQTKEHGTLIRILCQGKNSFNLSSTNPHSMSDDLILFNITIHQIAEVIWHRKRELK